MPLLKKRSESDVSGVGSTKIDEHIISTNASDSCNGSLESAELPTHEADTPTSCSKKRTGYETEDAIKPSKIAKGEPIADYLSISIQNEFLDDSDLDMELFRSNQDAEKLIQREAEKKQVAAAASKKPSTSTANLSYSYLLNDPFPENDSIDEFMSSKELDQLISSQASLVRPATSKTPLERHKSMPFQPQSSHMSLSDEAIAIMDDAELKSISRNGKVRPRNVFLERHNSMPASPTQSGLGPAMATRRRLLQSFMLYSGSILVSSESDSE